MHNLNRVKHAFNKANRSYDLHSSLQKHVGNQLIQLMLAVKHKEKLPRIIDLGCGTGATTQQLLNNIPVNELHAVDIAEDLLQIAKTRLQGKHISVYTRAFDQTHITDPLFDIAFSNMALHWSEHFTTTIHSLHAQLNKHGVIAFSVPLPGTLTELEPHFSINTFTPAIAIKEILAHFGFDLLVAENEKVTLNFTDTLSALKSIKQVGANATKSKVKKHLSGKSLTNRLDIRQLTYQIGYFIARKMEHPCHTNFSLPAPTHIAAKPTSALGY